MAQPHTNTTRSLTPHFVNATYLAALHPIPILSRHTGIWYGNAMGIW